MLKNQTIITVDQDAPFPTKEEEQIIRLLSDYSVHKARVPQEIKLEQKSLAAIIY